MIPKGIVIHHSLTKDGLVPDFEAIRRYHMQHKGWSDVGYHFLIERVGDDIKTFEGRPTNKIGAHCLGKNNYIGICVVGNFDIGFEVLSEDKMQALVALTIGMMTVFPHITLNHIHRHHDFHPKSCPGTGFPWDEYMSLVADSL